MTMERLITADLLATGEFIMAPGAGRQHPAAVFHMRFNNSTI